MLPDIAGHTCSEAELRELSPVAKHHLVRPHVFQLRRTFQDGEGQCGGECQVGADPVLEVEDIGRDGAGGY